MTAPVVVAGIVVLVLVLLVLVAIRAQEIATPPQGAAAPESGSPHVDDYTYEYGTVLPNFERQGTCRDVASPGSSVGTLISPRRDSRGWHADGATMPRSAGGCPVLVERELGVRIQ